MNPAIQKCVVTSLLFGGSAAADIVQPDTTSPHQFWFSQAEYVVSENATNAVITVSWQPGDRGYSGWVDFYTENETAFDGSDYTAASGRVYFSGPGPRTISVPIRPDCDIEEDETFRVYLVNTNAIISQNAATVRIQNGSCVPTLSINPTGSNTIALAWTTNATGFVLEQSTDFNEWIEVTTPVLPQGENQTTATTANAGTFFRLRKSAP